MPQLWLVHALVPALVVGPIVYAARRRVAWRRWELLVFVLPFLVWIALMSTQLRPKSLANIGEIGEVSIAIAVAAIVRVVLGPRWPQAFVAAAIQFLVCAFAAAVYWFTPLLPE